MSATTERDFELSVRFQARGCVAWDDENPAKGFKGQATRRVALSTANTVVACMHPGNYCCDDGIAWGPESPYAWWAGKMANLPRAKQIIDKRIAPLLNTVRESGMKVIYLLQGWPCATRYPQYRAIASRVKEPVDDATPRSPDESWREERDLDIYGPDWRTRERTRQINEAIDVAPAIAPQPEDWVVATTAQASTLLSENRISNVLYTGFDTGGCVWLSAGGMHQMGKLGYRCILLRDCTTGGETAETYPAESVTRAFMTLVEIGGYTADSGDLRHALTTSPS